MDENDKKLWKFLLGYLRKQMLRIFILGISTIMLVIIQVYIPIVWGRFVLLLTNFEIELIQKNITTMGSLMFLELLLRFWQNSSLIYLMKIINVEMQNDLYLNLLELKLSYFDKSKSAQFITRIETDITRIVEIIVGSLIPCTMSLISLFAMSLVMLRMNRILAFITILFFPLNYLLYKKQVNVIRDNQENIRRKKESLISIIQQTINGIRFIKLMDAKNVNKNMFGKVSEELNAQVWKLKQKILKVGVASGVITLVSQVTLYIAGGMFVLQHVIGIDYFITFYKYTQSFKSDSKILVDFIPSVQEVLISLRRVYELEENDMIKDSFGTQSVLIEHGEIRVNNLNFRYTNSNKILENMNAVFKPNVLNVIFGESGSGKTTLLNLITKLYDVTDETIFIDHTDINKMSEKSIRSAISIVSQEHFLFNMSIAENFKMVNPEISEEFMKDICKKCKMDRYIMQLPQGYNTVINENLFNFSMGQKQRLSIARALVKQSKILILDEPTSALDRDTEAKIIELLKELKETITIIAITHNPALINAADIVCELKGHRKFP